MRFLPPVRVRTCCLPLAFTAGALPSGALSSLAGVLAAGVAAVALPGRAHAQTDQTGLLRGLVTDAAGKALAAVTVEVAQADGSYPRTARTDAAGTFRVGFLVPGTYVVRARAVGFRAAQVSGVVVRAAQTTTLPVRLAASVAQLGAVTVTAAPNAIDRATNEVASTTLGARERELLPTSRDATALVQFTPGAQAATGGTDARLAGTQVFGGSGDQANLWRLDGVTANQPGQGGAFVVPNVDWIESIEVKGLGVGAEYGDFQGGLVNIVTKSGSNTRQGAVRTFYENRALNANNTNAFALGSRLASRYEVNAEARGPIVRDRLFYYVSAQDARDATQVVDNARSTGAGGVFYLPVNRDARDQRFLGKLTWQAGNADQVNATLGYTTSTTQRSGLSAFDAVDATYRLQQPTTFGNLSYQHTFGGRTFLEARASGFTGRNDQAPYNGSDRSAVACFACPGQFNNAYYTWTRRPSNATGLLALDTYRTLGGVEHHLKVGAEYTSGRYRERRTRNGNLTWYFLPRADSTKSQDAADPANWQDLGFGDGTYATTDNGGDVDLNARVDNGAAWVQDYIAVTRRLTLAPGVRLGTWRGYLTPGNGGGSRGTDQFTAVRATAFDPRLGANLDVLGDNSLVLKAQYGRFRQNLFALMFDRAPGGNVFTNITYYDWNDTSRQLLPNPNQRYTPAEIAQLFHADGGAQLFAEANGFPNYRQPYVNQVTFGLEKAVGRHYRAEAAYVGRRNRDVLALTDRNLAANWSRLTDVAVSQAVNGQSAPVLDQNGRPLVLPVFWVRNDDLRAQLLAGNRVPGYTLADTARLAYDPDLVVAPNGQATRKFDQLQLTLTGTFPAWTFTGSVALTRLRGNLFSVDGYDNPLGQGLGAYVQPNGQTNAYGNLDNYSPLDVKLRAAGQLPYGFQGGLFLTATAGNRYTPVFYVNRRAYTYAAADPAGGSVALPRALLSNVDGQSVYLEPRGDRALPSLRQLDVRLERGVPLRGGARAIVGLEVFNLLNGNAVTVVNPLVSNVDPSNPLSRYGVPTLRQTPRTLRLNAQLRF